MITSFVDHEGNTHNSVMTVRIPGIDDHIIVTALDQTQGPRLRINGVWASTLSDGVYDVPRGFSIKGPYVITDVKTWEQDE